MRELRDNQSSHIAALLRYRPRQFRGQVFSLVADQMFERKTDPTLGWGKHVSGGVKIYRGTGNHDSFIRDHTQKVGSLIRDWLKLIENGKMNGRPG